MWASFSKILIKNRNFFLAMCYCIPGINLTKLTMKKIVTVGIVMILTGVLLSGCSWFQPPQEEVKDDQKDKTETTQVIECLCLSLKTVKR